MLGNNQWACLRQTSAWQCDISNFICLMLKHKRADIVQLPRRTLAHKVRAGQRDARPAEGGAKRHVPAAAALVHRAPAAHEAREAATCTEIPLT